MAETKKTKKKKKATSSTTDRLKQKPSRKQLLKRRKRRNRVIRRVILCVVTVILLALGALLAVMGTIFYGPSQTACDRLVTSLLETSALKFVPRLYFPEETVQEIIKRNAVIVPEEATDTSLVVINTAQVDPDAPDESYQDIELRTVIGSTYKGYMLIVRDPSRVSVGVCNNPFSGTYGKYLNEIADEAGAIAAINAGGFEDDGGQGHGGIPTGIVYSGGEMLWSKTDPYYDTLIGFDKDDKLILATGITAEKSKELNLRDAVTFGPALVVNGEASSVTSSSGLNPRTAIGQRADGAVLLLVIDGRQASSLGATYADLISVMVEYGAVNAVNLDGGSSSLMYYKGEYLNKGVILTGSRDIPTAFVVR